ncbi:MAG: hypothetical protein WAU75_08000 [Solirubrobacteraceae bacterium]
MSRIVCAIATRRQLPGARALARALRVHDPGVRCLVLVLDDVHYEVSPAPEPFQIVRPESLDLSRFGLLAGIHAAPELEVVVRPAFLRHALDQAEGPVIHLGADTALCGSLGPVFELLERHPIVLVPRLHAPVPRDHVRLTDADVARRGVFDPGMLGVAPGADLDGLLRAWSDRVELDSSDETPLPSGRFLDMAPGFVPAAHILVDAGIGVSHLNLHERRISRHQERWWANDRPLVTFDFDGMEVTRQDEMVELVAGHLQELDACGRAEADGLPYGYDQLADGTPLTPRLRVAIRDAELYGRLARSPFSAVGTSDLLQWLNAPAPHGAIAGVTRYWFQIYQERLDLQLMHPDLDGAGGSAFVRWAQDAGREQYGTPDPLLPLDG